MYSCSIASLSGYIHVAVGAFIHSSLVPIDHVFSHCIRSSIPAIIVDRSQSVMKLDPYPVARIPIIRIEDVEKRVRV
jgi:hypothetical protein